MDAAGRRFWNEADRASPLADVFFVFHSDWIVFSWAAESVSGGVAWGWNLVGAGISAPGIADFLASASLDYGKLVFEEWAKKANSGIGPRHCRCGEIGKIRKAKFGAGERTWGIVMKIGHLL